MTRIAESLVESRGLETDVPPGVLAAHTAPAGDLAATLRARLAAACPDPSIAPLGLALATSVLWSRFHAFDAADPGWPDRDRMVFSGRTGALLHGVLRGLSGDRAVGLSHPSLDAAAGPRGQGLGHAVGLALAERLLAARFGRSLVDHRTWLLASDGDVMGGLSHEVASLAGHLRLGRLTVLWDESGTEDDAASQDAVSRFATYGWTVRRIDGQNEAAIATALTLAVRSPKPTLVVCRHSESDIAADGVAAADDPDEVVTAWAVAGARGSAARRAWLKRLTRHALRGEFERVMAGRLPDALMDALAGLRASFAGSRPAMATRAASQSVLEAVAPRLPELVGGSADLGVKVTGHFVGLNLTARGAGGGHPGRWGEHGMAAAMNGLALHGGLIPYGGTFVAFTDYMRPALRMAALMRQRVIHVLTRDGCDRAEDSGDDGPSHQAIEQLASLRAVPNVHVFRPADAIETAECWELAFARADGPSLLALSRQPVPSLRPPGPPGENRAARGGYVLADAEGPRQATLIATGPEVATAMAARELLREEGIRVAVVSLPCWELFEALPKPERDAVLGTAPRVGIEAAGPFGWDRWLGEGEFVGFGAHQAGGRASSDGCLAWTAQGRPTSADVVAAVRRGVRPN